MAGFFKAYLLGPEGGFMGADGLNSLDLIILQGISDRSWFEARYLWEGFSPLGKLQVIIPTDPEGPDGVLDAFLAFAPQLFTECPSLNKVKEELGEAARLDFYDRETIPPSWSKLREEARKIFQDLNIYEAEFRPWPGRLKPRPPRITKRSK